VDEGWIFPSESGGLRTPGGLWKAWQACLKESTIEERFTTHGLRRTFNDLTRRAGVDGLVIKSLTGHVTEKMRSHYSTVGLDEKLVAVSSVHRLVPLGSGDGSGDANGEHKKTGER
jgi:integrase